MTRAMASITAYVRPVDHVLLEQIVRAREWREFTATAQLGGPNGEERRSPEDERPACVASHPVGVTAGRDRHLDANAGAERSSLDVVGVNSPMNAGRTDRGGLATRQVRDLRTSSGDLDPDLRRFLAFVIAAGIAACAAAVVLA